MIEAKSYNVESTITIGGIKFRHMSNGYISFESAANECHRIKNRVKKDGVINANDVEFTVTKQENNN